MSHDAVNQGTALQITFYINTNSLTMAPKWSKADDKKLAELFRKSPSKGGVSTRDLSAKTVRAVGEKHWPGREYKSFGPLFRKKA